MHVPLLARTCSPTFYLYRHTYICSYNVNILCIWRPCIYCEFTYEIKWYQTLSRYHIMFIWSDIIWWYPGNPYSLKATGYMGYNLSIYIVTKICKISQKYLYSWMHTKKTFKRKKYLPFQGCRSAQSPFPQPNAKWNYTNYIIKCCRIKPIWFLIVISKVAKLSSKITRPVLDRFHDSSKVKALSFMLYALCSRLFAKCLMLNA